MTILSAILLAVMIVFVLKSVGLIIEYLQLWDSLFYIVVVVLITIFILILTGPISTNQQLNDYSCQTTHGTK